MSKRGATNELTKDNWEEEYEPEETGIFQKASDETLRTRVIKKAKRKGDMHNENITPVFNNFTAFSSKAPAAPTFSFGMDKTPSMAFSFNKPELSSSKAENHLLPKTTVPTFKCTPSIDKQNIEPAKEKTISSLQTVASPVKKLAETSKDLYLASLKALNNSAVKWLQENIDKNPYIDLSPVFDDYKKHLSELKEKSAKENSDVSKSNLSNQTPTGINFLSNSSRTGKKEVSTTGFSFGDTAKPVLPSFSFSSQPMKTTVQATVEVDDEPPVVIIDEDDVKEEGSIYDKKVKLFYQKDGNYVEKGVGMLFLKPNGEKIQLIIRALTSLKSILLNIILNNSIPSKRLGKNNVLITCIPNPPIEPKGVPVSMLIRVKTSEQADELLSKIEENKK